MPTENGLYVVLVDAHGAESSERVPCEMCGGNGGHGRHLAKPVALMARWSGYMTPRLGDSSVPGAFIRFDVNDAPFLMGGEDWLYLS